MKLHNLAAIVLLCAAQALAFVCSAAAGDGQVRRTFDIRTPMRDGVQLSGDVWLPGSDGRFPTILIRTPYMKASQAFEMATFGNYFAKHGYALVAQDIRGRGDSDGNERVLVQEGHDGYDTIEWIAQQPWSNGEVCMMGLSYLGLVQWLAAKENPPHLKCIAPTASHGIWLTELPYYHGAFNQSFMLGWFDNVAARNQQGANAAGADLDKVYRHRPLITMDEAFGRKMPGFREWLQHPTNDGYWDDRSWTKDFGNIALPAMHTTGWCDEALNGSVNSWMGMMRDSKSRSDQYLIIGPWNHWNTLYAGVQFGPTMRSALQLGELRLPPESVMDNLSVHLAFFDRYLKHSTDNFPMAKVHLYVTGFDRWRDDSTYPPAAAKTRRLALSSEGHANSSSGDGKLVWQLDRAQQVDTFQYDPSHPVEIDGLFPKTCYVDHRAIAARDDVLVYKSRPLLSPLEVIGPISLELYAASDARDTDFTAAILDVYPDGRAVTLGPRGFKIIRARYRNGSAKEELLTPGKIEKYVIDLGHLGHAFLPGHAIGVEVSSSAFPLYSVNPNTGNPIATDVAPFKIARQQIYHDAQHPSALILPVVDDGA